MITIQKDEFFMNQALQEAQAAWDEGEVPVGAVVVMDGRIVARAHNRVESTHDATAHAEIIAIGAASNYLNDWRLEGASLYVTLEPCPMCLGAVLNSRVSRVVFGAHDKRLGACGSACNLTNKGLLNRELQIVSNVMKMECAGILKGFFASRRRK